MDSGHHETWNSPRVWRLNAPEYKTQVTIALEKKEEIVPLQSVLEELVKRLQFGYVGAADSSQQQ